MVMGQGLCLIGFYCFTKERSECEVGVVSRRDGFLIQSLAGVIALNAALKWRARVCFPVHCLEGVCGTEQNALGSSEYFSENSYLKLNPMYLNYL